MYLVTAPETTNSSAWNHIFNFQRRGAPRRRARKLVSLCHTHGSSPRSPYPPCQIVVQEKSSELRRAEIRNVPKGKFRGRGGSSCRFDRRFGKKKNVGNATQVRVSSSEELANTTVPKYNDRFILVFNTNSPYCIGRFFHY